MALKTDVSILQELVVLKGLPHPLYNFEDISSRECVKFRCTVAVGEIKMMAEASSKKAAKQGSAKAILEVLGLSNKIENTADNITAMPTPIGNYIGQLNECCSKWQITYPVYIAGSMNNVGHFTMTCQLEALSVIGSGFTKKEAKQNSAREMLLLVKKTPMVKSETEPKCSCLETVPSAMDRNVLKQFEELSFVNTTKKSTIIADVDVNELKDIQRKYTVTVLQKDPYVLLAKALPDFTLIQYGSTYSEAHAKLVDLMRYSAVQ